MIHLDPYDPRLQPDRLREFHLALREIGPKARRVYDSIGRLRDTHAFDVADDTTREQLRTVRRVMATIPRGLAPTDRLLRRHLADQPPEIDIDAGTRAEPWRVLATAHALLVYFDEIPSDEHESTTDRRSGPNSESSRATRRTARSTNAGQLSLRFDQGPQPHDGIDLAASLEGNRVVSAARFRTALFTETARRTLATDTCSLFPQFVELYTDFCDHLDNEFDRRLGDLSVAMLFQ